MAFDPTPTTHITSWSEDGTDISVPLASFPELTAVEADAATGDIRKIVYALCHKFHALYNAMATADRPTKFSASSGSSISGDTITRSYTFTFKLEAATIEVSAE